MPGGHAVLSPVVHRRTRTWRMHRRAGACIRSERVCIRSADCMGRVRARRLQSRRSAAQALNGLHALETSPTEPCPVCVGCESALALIRTR
eukprot:6187744-Pleurochrysis_carterae.AAC.5